MGQAISTIPLCCLRNLAVACMLLGMFAPMANAIEEPDYTVVQQYEGFEIRQYAPHLVAEVLMPGPSEAAGNQGFRVLARYIFGGNKGERKIAMAAPVTQAAAAPVKIAQPESVMQTTASGGYVVQFMMPRQYTLDTLPEPLDSRVKLKEVAGGRFAVIRYSGTWSERNYQEHLEQLQNGIAAAGLRTTGNPIYSRYNAPFVPWFLRRNEIWLPLD